MGKVYSIEYKTSHGYCQSDGVNGGDKYSPHRYMYIRHNAYYIYYYICQPVPITDSHCT